MSVDEGEGMAMSEMDAQIVERLFDYAEGADDREMSFAEGRKAAQVLFAIMASVKMNPAAIPVVVEDGRHPMFARQFAAVNATRTNQSWASQEQRVLKRYSEAKDKVRDATLLCEAAEAQRREAEAELDQVSAEMALIARDTVRRQSCYGRSRQPGQCRSVSRPRP
ncbi:hypothetical protein J3454_10950 [Erythrobacter sp. NFXS35]|uniref:hypothetical protein n=1 Tax=Erythrobacter sp. NFXS35 TaxID=2818436 RepID=UPI0032E013B0